MSSDRQKQQFYRMVATSAEVAIARHMHQAMGFDRVESCNSVSLMPDGPVGKKAKVAARRLRAIAAARREDPTMEFDAESDTYVVTCPYGRAYLPTWLQADVVTDDLADAIDDGALRPEILGILGER